MQSPSKNAKLIHDTYRLYTKLLSAENITVVFDQQMSAPADFDLINRVLRVSPVHSTQVHLIPGLVVHEVGHALFSHLSKEDAKKIKRISTLLNIIDDGYQERMMCQKFSGAKDLLFVVFKEFFIDYKIDFETGNKITDIFNVLNYNCKGFKYGYFKEYGSYILPEDLALLKEAEICTKDTFMKRWEFSKELAKALLKYGEIDKNGKDLNLGDSTEEKSNGKENSNNGGENTNQDLELDKLLNEEDFHDHHKKIEYEPNKKAESIELINPNELEQLSKIVNIKDSQSIDKIFQIIETDKNLKLIIDFRIAEAKKVATKLFTQFNARVQAKNFALSQYKQTGSLDGSRAALYKITDDIFVKQSIEPNQINHAYCVALDWSGSMWTSIYPLILRTIELLFFAKMADIELEAFAYTTKDVDKKEPITDKIFRNVAFNSSIFYDIGNTKKSSNVDLVERMKLLLAVYYCMFGTNTLTPKDSAVYWPMSGTNIFEGLLRAHGKLEKMDADKKTCLILSDGCDNSSFSSKYSIKKNKIELNKSHNIYFNGISLDSFSGFTEKAKASLAIADFYKQAGHKTVGVAWDTSEANLNKFCEKVIKQKSEKNAETSGYIYANNFFIAELISSII